MDPKYLPSRAWQKWQCMGCLTSGRASVNKHSLYGPLLETLVFVDTSLIHFHYCFRRIYQNFLLST